MTSRYLDTGDAVPLRPAVARALATRIPNKKNAARAGRDEALFLQQLEYWLHRRGGKEHNGHHWVYRTYDQWACDLAMGSAEVIAVITRLLDAGFVVQIANPEQGFYQTRWYRIDYGRLDSYLDLNLPADLVTNPAMTLPMSSLDGSQLGVGPVANASVTHPNFNTETTTESPSETTLETTATSARARGLAKDRLRLFCRARLDAGLGKSEYLDEDLGKDEWFQAFIGLEASDDDFASGLYAAMTDNDREWRRRMKGPRAAQAFVGEFHRLVPGSDLPDWPSLLKGAA
jgi:hypothetical protein